MRRLVITALASWILAATACDECPDKQSPCEDERGDTHCFHDYYGGRCDGPGRFFCPPLVCEEGAEARCVNFASSSSHCGGCDIACPPNTVCQNSQCVPAPVPE